MSYYVLDFKDVFPLFKRINTNTCNLHVTILICVDSDVTFYCFTSFFADNPDVDLEASRTGSGATRSTVSPFLNIIYIIVSLLTLTNILENH